MKWMTLGMIPTLEIPSAPHVVLNQIILLIVMGFLFAIIVDLLTIIGSLYLILGLIGKKRILPLDMCGNPSPNLDISPSSIGMRGLLNYVVWIPQYLRECGKGYGFRCGMENMAPLTISPELM